MADLKDIGVAIVNYNAGDDIIECINSVKAEGITDISVADNGSTDGSDLRLQEVHPDVKFNRLNDKGFGSGQNRAIAELNNKYILSLNPDSKVHPGAFKAMLETIETDPKIGMVGPKILNVDGTQYPSARRFPSLNNSIGHALFGAVWSGNPWTKRYRRIGEDYSTRQDVDWVSGAAMLHRREAFLSVDGFDPGYYLYMEDTDLCWKLHKEGWRIVFEPKAEITHIGGTATGRKPYKRLKVHHRSAFRYNYRTARGGERLLLPVFGAGLLARLGVALVRQFFSKSTKTKQQKVS